MTAFSTVNYSWGSMSYTAVFTNIVSGDFYKYCREHFWLVLIFLPASRAGFMHACGVLMEFYVKKRGGKNFD